MYLDQPTIEGRFTAAFVAAMTVDAAGLASSISGAQSVVESALSEGGYLSAVPSSVYANVAACPTQIVEAALAAWWVLAHTMRGIPLPSPLPDNVAQIAGLPDSIRTGEIEIVGVPRSTSRAVGGVKFTQSDPNIEGSRPPVFGRGSMGGY